MVASALASGIIDHVVQPLPQYTQEQNTATGEYGYSYSDGQSAKTEYRALDGTTTGAYSYVDPYGLLQNVNYIADEYGFRAAGTNIPVDGAVPLDAPDVAFAKAAHLAEHARASLGHQRRKRGAILAPVALASPVLHALPYATSSQSRFQIHKSYPIVQSHALLYRKKRGIFAAPAALPIATTYTHTLPYATSSQSHFQVHNSAPLVAAAPVVSAAAPIVEARAALPIATTYTHALPYSTSSQSRFQIHNSAKIIEEVHQPLYAPVAAAPIVETRAAVPVVASAAPILKTLPYSTSSQSRFQIHKGAKIIEEIHQPLYAPVAAAPAAIATEYIPSRPAFLPSQVSLPAVAAPAATPIAEGIYEDAVAVESA